MEESYKFIETIRLEILSIFFVCFNLKNVFFFVAGLAILVNTCCPLTQAHYAKFCGHVTAVAMLDKDLVPVTNRYAMVESSLNSFMHGYVIDIP